MSMKPNIKVGDRFLSNNCGWCTVTKYNLYSDITIVFDNFSTEVQTTGGKLRKGQFVNPEVNIRRENVKYNHLSEIVEYDETSPSGLRWKVFRYSGKDNLKVQCYPGDVVGSCHGGYWKINIDGLKSSAHRVVWVLFHGEIDSDLFIDHIDGDGTNNKIENLRLVPRVINARNAKKNINNSTGVSGVKYQTNTDRKGDPYYYYVAVWRNIDNTESCKCFPVAKLGDAIAFEMACEHRKKMIEELNALGAGYTERHGT